MTGRCQGHLSNPYSFDQYVSYIYPRRFCHQHPSKTYNTADTTLPTDPTTTSMNDKVNAHPPLTEDQMDTLRLMQRLLSGKAHSHEADTFMHIKGFMYKHVMDSNLRFLALVIPKSWHFTVLVGVHDKLGHQGVN